MKIKRIEKQKPSTKKNVSDCCISFSPLAYVLYHVIIDCQYTDFHMRFFCSGVDEASTKARQSKQKARQDAFYKLEKSTKPRVKDPTLELSEDGQRRLGGNILKMRNVSLSFGDKKMLSDFSYDFNKGDRIGIVGRNGVGKVSSACLVTPTRMM